MLVIILFATNSFSLRSIEKSPKLIKNQVNSLKNFLEKDIKVMFIINNHIKPLE
jgi:hypothetical protein